MDREQLNRRAARAAADTAARNEAAEARGDAERVKAGNKLQYMFEQDALTAAVRDWMDFAGIDRSGGVGGNGVDIRTDRLAQQTRGRHGAAHTDSRRLKPMSHTVENVTSFETSRSHLIKVGDGFFAGDPDNRTEMYVEFLVEEPTTLTGKVTRRQLNSAKPRVDSAAERSRGPLSSAYRRLRHGPALGTEVVQDNGEPAATGIGIRIFRGPAADVLLKDPANPAGKRLGQFNRGAKLPNSDQLALCAVDSYDAKLIDWADRRQLTEPQRVFENPKKNETVDEHRNRVNRAIHFAGNVHLPYENLDTGRPNPLTNINDVLRIMAEEQAAGNLARAVDIP